MEGPTSSSLIIPTPTPFYGKPRKLQKVVSENENFLIYLPTKPWYTETHLQEALGFSLTYSLGKICQACTKVAADIHSLAFAICISPHL